MSDTKKYNTKKAIEFRHHLHRNPELSGSEKQTTKFIRNELEQFNNCSINILNSYGLVAEFISQSENPKTTILIRGDIDALPIKDNINTDYVSENEGVGHKCGHDGHSSILFLLAQMLDMERPKNADILLLFQPSEENGQGAAKVLEDEKFTYDPDYVFALHNLPGHEESSIIINKNVFSSSVISCAIELEGETAHAAEPQNAHSPTPVIMQLIEEVSDKENMDTESEDFFISTAVHINVGDKNYGITPGKGEIHFTLRAHSNDKLDKMKSWLSTKVENLCNQHSIDYDISWLEEFRATENDKKSVNFIENSADELNLRIVEKSTPFSWGEDFGLFTEKFRGAMFGLGAGQDSYALHHPSYDFNDNIIETGGLIFYEIIKNICSEMEETHLT